MSELCTVERESLAGRMFGEFILFRCLVKKVWWMNRSAKRLLIVTTTLDGFSLANHRRFTKFAKFSIRQTFPIYGICKSLQIDFEIHSEVSFYDTHLHSNWEIWITYIRKLTPWYYSVMVKLFNAIIYYIRIIDIHILTCVSMHCQAFPSVYYNYMNVASNLLLTCSYCAYVDWLSILVINFWYN